MMRAARLVALAAILPACAADPAPVKQKLQFLVDPASQMCMPVVTCDHDDGQTDVVGCAGQAADAPWMGWSQCPDPCAGRTQVDCKLDPRCLATGTDCVPVPSTDPCLGLDEKTCGATPGCQPIYGGVVCDCPVQPDGSAQPCACPEIAAYRGCASAVMSPRCVADADCPAGARCSTDDGDCGPPPGCDGKEVCPAVCGGVCVPDDACRPDAAGACQTPCGAIGDERTCVARADCEPVYVGSRCFCDAAGCGCLDYSYDSCRARPAPPPCDPTSVAGAWASDVAPRRVYTIQDDGRFSVSDAVAPCPPGAVCVWSGIVVNQGTWRADASGAIELTYPSLQTFEGLVFPTTLYVKSCDTLVEGDTGRAFTR